MSSYFDSYGSYVDLLGSPRVFMHEINTLPMFSKIASRVDEIEKYERVLPISRPNDIVLTKTMPEKAYQKWLHSVGLGQGKVVVVTGSSNETLPERAVKNGLRKKLDDYYGDKKKLVNFSPYYGGLLESRASQHLDLQMYANSNLVLKYDSKINFKNLCKSVGVPIIEDVTISRQTDKSTKNLHILLGSITEFLSKSDKLIVKGEFGASGSTTTTYTDFDLQKLKQLVNQAKLDNCSYMVEPFLPSTASPSSLWFISKEHYITHIRTSNQVLSSDGLVHTGNEFPVPFNEEELRNLSYKVANKLNQEGYIGPFGMDYIVSKGKFYAVECNPRVTGANYPWELVHLLNNKHGPCDFVKAARSQNVHLSKKGLSFEDFAKQNHKILYTGETANGIIIPYNVGPIASGKVTVLATGSNSTEVRKLLDRVQVN